MPYTVEEAIKEFEFQDCNVALGKPVDFSTLMEINRSLVERIRGLESDNQELEFRNLCLKNELEDADDRIEQLEEED